MCRNHFHSGALTCGRVEVYKERMPLLTVLLYSFLGTFLTLFAGTVTHSMIKILPPYGYALRADVYVCSAYIVVKGLSKSVGLTLADCRIPYPHISVRGICSAVLISVLFLGINIWGQPGSWRFHAKTWKETEEAFFYLIFYTGFCSSIVEEMVFRGYLVKLSENRWGRRKGMILPGLLFGLVHSFPFGTSYLYGQLFFYLSISILFTVMTYRSGSIWDSVLVHAFWDIFVVRNIVFSIDHQENTESFFSYVLTGNVPNPILELSMTQRYVLYSIAFLVLAGMVQMFFCPRRQKQTEFKSLGKS